MFRHRSRRLLATVLTLLGVAAMIPAGVLAHAELEATFPQADAEVSTPPDAVAARFSEAIESNSTIELVGPDGTTVTTGGLDPDDPARLLADVPDGLGAGAYEVEWQAFSADGHLERGTFGFTVLAPAPTPTAAPSDAPTAEPTQSAQASLTPPPTEAPLPTASAGPADPADPAGGTDVLLPIVAALAVMAVLALVLLRGRRSRPA